MTLDPLHRIEHAEVVLPPCHVTDAGQGDNVTSPLVSVGGAQPIARATGARHVLDSAADAMRGAVVVGPRPVAGLVAGRGRADTYPRGVFRVPTFGSAGPAGQAGDGVDVCVNEVAFPVAEP